MEPGEPDCEPRRLDDKLADPPGVLIEYDWSERMELFEDSTPQKLPLKTILDKLRGLTRDAGDEQSFDAAYVIMFRGLSTVGAHTNVRILDWYLDDDSGRATFVRACPTATPPSSMKEANQMAALLLVAHLAQLVLDARGCPHPCADRIVNRFLAMTKQLG